MENSRHLNENELALYADGLRLRRLEAVPGRIRDHVQFCLECKRAIMEIAAAVPASAYRPGESHPYFDTRPNGIRWFQGTGAVLRMAAGIVLLLGAGIFILYNATHRAAPDSTQAALRPPGNADTPAPSARAREQAPPAIAGAFRPSPLYDRLTSEELRSGSGVSHHPANGDTISGGQLFTWYGGTGTAPFGLTFLDNRGREVVQASVNGGSFRLTKQLPAGLYYWKLERAGDLVFIGKFYVVN